MRPLYRPLLHTFLFFLVVSNLPPLSPTVLRSVRLLVLYSEVHGFQGWTFH
jgi:hypothetical protein